jgi:hypothetical protein
MTKETTASGEDVVPWMGHALEVDMGSNTKETCHIRRCAIHLFGCSAQYNFRLNVGVPFEIGV